MGWILNYKSTFFDSRTIFCIQRSWKKSHAHIKCLRCDFRPPSKHNATLPAAHCRCRDLYTVSLPTSLQKMFIFLLVRGSRAAKFTFGQQHVAGVKHRAAGRTGGQQHKKYTEGEKIFACKHELAWCALRVECVVMRLLKTSSSRITISSTPTRRSMDFGIQPLRCCAKLLQTWCQHFLWCGVHSCFLAVSALYSCFLAVSPLLRIMDCDRRRREKFRSR